MPRFDLEYTICLIQRDIFSFARKSHRQQGGNPQLEIDVNAVDVTWTLLDIDRGDLETADGVPRVDRIDFYFTIVELQRQLPLFPPSTGRIDPNLRFEARDSTGTERPDGARVPMVTPIRRFYPIRNIRLEARSPTPFEAIANEGTLHLDIETGPVAIYGTRIFEAHLGIEAQYTTAGLPPAPVPSHASFRMSHDMYATVVNELRGIR